MAVYNDSSDTSTLIMPSDFSKVCIYNGDNIVVI